MSADNTVFIGKKPTMNYVLAVVTLFKNGNDKVNIKARGKAISRAVDVALITQRRFVTDATIEDIKIMTEEVPTGDEDLTKVSSIEIIMGRQE
ncbi:MAG: archaea-specific DNA-binding protein [Candidatus Methanomethylophilaceae archaeon]|nr:archaea-specific DNA-binding protein [Candidatus Methanomethylophilaceae archaeon]MDI3541156.1 archaea-specific DNA-binding protein [Candidatus Methanomethylophilaceae archaeon]HIJ00240.1 DNA-binding protein Alba [Candidatus Methanomethylophilaceae archaeon]